MSLSANDVDKIRQLMQRVSKLETQAGNATRNIQRAPPAYLVVAPEGGIPAFDDPVPGQATCLMTRRFSNHPPEEKELAEMSTKQVVYNLGGKIAEGEIVIAHRDAFGDLFVQGAIGIVLRRCSDGLSVVSDDVKINDDAGLLSENIGKVVRLRESALLEESCWTIERVTTDCSAAICPIVCTLVDSCTDCVACWKLTACELVYPATEYVEKIIASDQTCDVAGTLDVGDIVLLDDGLCYTVSRADYCVGVEEVVILYKVDDCETCLHCYEVTNCYSEAVEIIYKDNHELVLDNVFRWDGQCWKVTNTGTCVAFDGAPVRIDDQVLAADVYADCPSCGCYSLIPCPGYLVANIVAYGAVNVAAEAVDLAPLAELNEIVRLSNGNCYTVHVNFGSCAGAVSVTIQESFVICDYCVCYTLEPCAGGDNIVTYSDLSDIYVANVVIRRAEGGGACFKILNNTATWSEAAVATTVEQVYPVDACTDCTSPKYHLTPTCPTCEETYGSSLSGCDHDGDNPRTIAGGGDPEITDHDLSTVVGQFIKVDKICYLVTPAANSEDVTTGFGSPLTHSGPFADCTACQKTCLWVVHQVEIDGGELIQIKSRIVVDQVCEEDVLLIEYIEVCP